MLRLTAFILFLFSHSCYADVVFLIHGLGRDSSCFDFLKSTLEQQSHTVFSLDYDSQRQTFEASLAQLEHQIMAIKSEWADSPVHFVGHSLGGLLSFRLYQSLPHSKKGVCITLGAPFLGSPAAAWLSGYPIMRAIQGPVLEQLGRPFLSEQEKNSYQSWLYCIAGDKPSMVNVLFFEQEPHDGMVTVSSAIPHHDWAHLIVHRSHNGLLYDELVASHIIASIT